MLAKTLSASALALAGFGMAIPAAAAPLGAPATTQTAFASSADWQQNTFEQYRGRYDRYRDYDRGARYYDDREYRDRRVWRGRDGRLHCRKTDGTIGLIVGGAAGAIIGREIDKRGDRTLGTVLGAAGGALLGKEVMSRTRCR